jgi:hypothetical protein
MLKHASGETQSDGYTRIGPKHIKATLNKDENLKQLAVTVHDDDDDNDDDDDDETIEKQMVGNQGLEVGREEQAFDQHSPPPSPTRHMTQQFSEALCKEIANWNGIVTCYGLEGSGFKNVMNTLTAILLPFSSSPSIAKPVISKSLQLLAHQIPTKFSFSYHVHLATSCLACQKKSKEYNKGMTIISCSPVEIFANTVYDMNFNMLTKEEFNAYRQLHEDMWPPIIGRTTKDTPSTIAPNEINIIVDAAPAAIIASRRTTSISSNDTSSSDDEIPFTELETRNAILFEAMITRIATHRDILVIDRWYAIHHHEQLPIRILRRLASIMRGQVRLPSVSLVENFGGLATLNEPILESPWRSTISPVVYGSNDTVFRAFDDLMQGKWEEGWFDANGNISHNSSSSSSSSSSNNIMSVADVYVHVAFWSSRWRTNQLMRVLSRHLSRCQNILFYTPAPKTSSDAGTFKNHPLVRWLSSLEHGKDSSNIGESRKREEVDDRSSAKRSKRS